MIRLDRLRRKLNEPYAPKLKQAIIGELIAGIVKGAFDARQANKILALELRIAALERDAKTEIKVFNNYQRPVGTSPLHAVPNSNTNEDKR